MKLFDGGRAPNPRRVRVFMAEKGIGVPLVPVDMAALEHKKEAISSRNPLMRLPVLELDDGTRVYDDEGIRIMEFAQCGVEPLIKLADDLGIAWHLIADGDSADTKASRSAALRLRFCAEHEVPLNSNTMNTAAAASCLRLRVVSAGASVTIPRA